MNSVVSRGTVLIAHDFHPNRKSGGDGIAVVTDNDPRSDFFTFMWVNGDPRVPGFSGDVGAVKHIDTWYTIIPEDQKHLYLPEDFVMPPDPNEDPMAAFSALFSGMIK